MKEIDLPIVTSFSLTVDLHNLPDGPVEERDGLKMVPIGSIDIGEKSKDIATVRSNGGKILYATTTIEKKLETIISLYLFGLFLGPSPPRSFFENELLGSSNMNLNFKKELVKKIINQEKYIEGKAKHDLERKLSEIIKWRNAFAHGNIQYDNVKGCFLKYYAGGNQQQDLNDEFWDLVVDTFKHCTESLKDVQEKIEKISIEQRPK